MTKSKDKSNSTAPKKKPNPYQANYRIRLNNSISKPKTTYICSLCRMSFPRKYNAERHLASCRSRLSTKGGEVIARRTLYFRPLPESAFQTFEINNSVFRDSPSLGLVMLALFLQIANAVLNSDDEELEENQMDDSLDLRNHIQGAMETVWTILLMETISDACPADPFRNVLDFVLIAFFNGNKMNLSMAKIKSIMTIIRLLFKLKERDNTLQLPKTDYIIHFNERKNTRTPFLTPTKQTGKDKKGDKHDFYMNKPSEYLKFLMVDPVKGTQLTTLPDHTTCETKSLQQGYKWRTHESFQQPMITLDNGNDVWVTDLVRYISDNAGSTFVAIDQDKWAFFISSIYQKVDKVYYACSSYCSTSFDANYQPIAPDHKALPFWTEQHSASKLKRQKADVNQSRQYNVFDSYLMTSAALSFDARSSKNNTYFICTSNKKLLAVDMPLALVDDLVELENGVVMYSVSHNEDVLVVASLLLIFADNYRQSELSMHKGSSAGHFSRKCLMTYQTRPNRPLRKNAGKEARLAYEMNLQNPKKLESITHTGCKPRKIEDLRIFLNSTDAKYLLKMKKEGYGRNGNELLRLRAFDPILDTPVGLLHTVPLGAGKGLVQLLWLKILKTTEKDLLQKAISEQRTSPAYTRNLRASLNHNGSFVERKLDLMAKCFDTLGCLTSLLYMRSVEGDLKGYTSLVMSLVEELSDRIFALDNHLIKNGVFLETSLSLQPKLHLLYHLEEDIIRFGLPVHYETEHGEQFNKFSREEIMRTRRHNPSRDVATSFAKQFAVHHVVNDGSFIVTKSRRDGTIESKRIMDAGYQIKMLKEEEPQFFDLVLNYRENADNNDYYEKTGNFLRVETAGIFTCLTSGINEDIIGIIDSIEKLNVQENGKDVKSAKILTLIICFLVDLLTQNNNIVMRKGTTVVQGLATEIELVQRFDMHLSLKFNKPEQLLRGDFKLLNVHKFGTLWTILQGFQVWLLSPESKDTCATVALGNRTTVSISNENSTSQTCAYCFHKLQHPEQLIQAKGKTAYRNMKGAFNCLSLECPSVRNDPGITGCDKLSALPIAIFRIASFALLINSPCLLKSHQSL
ncbi:hypothetical protein EDC96DRAFT_564490 [Choanephora cucurbitarum]|nr:hypothetical protein EDC96DRAFT_564490 [Choanephora cucurbitarum]